MKARICNQEIDQSKNPVYIVFEAGPTHTGLESAKKLVTIAKKAGAHAVKFQYLYADRLIADQTVPISYKYLKQHNGQDIFVEKTESLYEVLKRRELTQQEWVELREFCKKMELPLIMTATFPEEVDFLLEELKIDSLKLASADIDFLSFIRYCAKQCAKHNVNFQMDTGNADISEIEKAVSVTEEEGCNNLIIHLCPTGYPAYLESIHIRMIPTLKQIFFNHSIAFSDHSPGWDMDIAAISLGADMVEKTITLDRYIQSPEHSFSLEEHQACNFISSLQGLEKALGSSRRIIPGEEKKKRTLARRSPYALRNLEASEEIREEDFEFKRPETGLNSEQFELAKGKKLSKKLAKGEALNYNCF